jgi:hypothetical protein
VYKFELPVGAIDLLREVLLPAPPTQAVHFRMHDVQNESLTEDDVIQFLRSTPFPVQDVVLMQRGNGEYASTDSLGVFADGSLLAQATTGSKTVRILGVQRFNSTIASVCYSLAELTRRQVTANIYVTPPESAGSVLHTDPHDVLIVQVGGMKVWDTPGGTEDRPQSDSCTITVHTTYVGDVLLLPRGTVHAARTGNEFSAHITYGIANECA